MYELRDIDQVTASRVTTNASDAAEQAKEEGRESKEDGLRARHGPRSVHTWIVLPDEDLSEFYLRVLEGGRPTRRSQLPARRRARRPRGLGLPCGLTCSMGMSLSAVPPSALGKGERTLDRSSSAEQAAPHDRWSPVDRVSHAALGSHLDPGVFYNWRRLGRSATNRFAWGPWHAEHTGSISVRERDGRYGTY